MMKNDKLRFNIKFFKGDDLLELWMIINDKKFLLGKNIFSIYTGNDYLLLRSKLFKGLKFYIRMASEEWKRKSI